MKTPNNKSKKQNNKIEQKDHFIHKHGYATLFRNREMVEQLVKCFVDENFYKQLDFSKFEVNLEKSYLSDNYKEFADDVLIKVGWQGKDAYIYIIIEFQSTVERFMSLRVLNYLTMFYLEFISENKNVKMLPPVLPIVLYNGNDEWTAPDNIKDLIEPCTFLSKYYPDFKYFKIVENDYTEDFLMKLKNAVSAVFLMENTPKEKMSELVVVLEEHLSGESLETLKIFTIWVRQLLKNERIGSTIFTKIMNLKNTREVKSMLAETIQEIKQDYKRGKRDGEVLDKQNILIRQMERKFVALTAEEKKYIKSIRNPLLLNKALDEILFAERKEDILCIIKK